jgi:transposase
VPTANGSCKRKRRAVWSAQRRRAGLLTHVLVSKYCDYLSLYRQPEICAQEGVELERLTLANWAEETSALFALGGSAAASCDERD